MVDAKREMVISELSRLVDQRQLGLGKIQLQKLVYFLQNDNIDLGYKYTFYHYGPYSVELANDLDTLNILGIVKINAVDGGYGYHISPGSGATAVADGPEEGIEDIVSHINSILDKFGGCDASEIELKATIHYVYHVLRGMAVPSDSSAAFRTQIETRVQQLKPKFTPDQVRKAYDDLLELGYLGD